MYKLIYLDVRAAKCIFLIVVILLQLDSQSYMLGLGLNSPRCYN